MPFGYQWPCCTCGDVPPPPHCVTTICNCLVARCGVPDGDMSGITLTITSTPVSPSNRTYADQVTTSDHNGGYCWVNPITVDNYGEYAMVTITASYPGYASSSYGPFKTGCSGPLISFADQNNYYIVLSPDSDHACACMCLLPRTLTLTCSKGTCTLVWSDANRAWIGTLSWTEPEGATYVSVPNFYTRPCTCAVKSTVTAHAFFVLSCGSTSGGGPWSISMTSAFNKTSTTYDDPDCTRYSASAPYSYCQQNDPDNYRFAGRYTDSNGGYSLGNVPDPYGGLSLDCGSAVNLTFTFNPPTWWPLETPTSVTISE